MKGILKRIIRPVYKILTSPNIRYSRYFQALQNIFIYSPKEEILKNAMSFAEVSKLEGDYLEFGVYEGKTFIRAYHFAKMRRLNSMRFYAFDSFEGLPEIKGIDTEGFEHFKKGEYFCTAEEFKEIISKKGVDLNKVEIISGWYDKTLNKKTKKYLPIKKAAVIYIDCDLYESTVPVLNFITDYIQDGTILIFDDWFCFRGNPDKGEQKAFKEWLSKNPTFKASEFHKIRWQGNSFIIHKKD